jgi:hypothetical protein
MISTIFTTAINVNIGLYVSSQRLIANCLHRLPATKAMLHLSVRRKRSPGSSTIQLISILGVLLLLSFDMIIAVIRDRVLIRVSIKLHSSALI